MDKPLQNLQETPQSIYKLPTPNVIDSVHFDRVEKSNHPESFLSQLSTVFVIFSCNKLSQEFQQTRRKQESRMSISPSLFNRRFGLFDPFQSFFSDNSDLLGATTNTEVDWKETKHAHVFEVDLPGLSKNDVKLELHEGRVLEITGERNEVEAGEKDETWHCKERTTGKFTRRFRLPENAKTDGIKASMENGVLTVTVPKDEEVKKPKHRAIEVSGDEDHEQQRTPKGLGRFVCCKA